MQKYVLLHKRDFDHFIARLAAGTKVVAPRKRGIKNFAFQEVTSGKEVSLQYIPTILPPKKYFMPQSEKLAEYNIDENKWEAVLEYEEIIIFGVHTCDLAAIQCLDAVFSDEPPDANYTQRRAALTIIGLECNDYCDEYASCKVVGNHLPQGGCDLIFTQLPSSFIVGINTSAGERIVEKTGVFTDASKEEFEQLKIVRERKTKIFKDEVSVKRDDLKPLFDNAFSAKVWDDLGRRCLACGNCTNVCPTCYCFDIRDEINFDLNTGFRYRVWDSCQNEKFAKVAGGKSFRAKRGERQRHRYLRKFNYPVDRYKRYFCTGCGRCTRSCMAAISLKETIEALAAEKG